MSIRACYILLSVFLIVVLFVGEVSDAQIVNPPRQNSLNSVIKLAVQQLIEEGLVELENKKLSHDKADFKERFKRAIPDDDVLVALATRQHDNWFVDAYVRWQLTSFDPPFQEFNDAAFNLFMRSAPRLLFNPKADPQVLDTFRQAQDIIPLTNEQIEILRVYVEEIEQRTIVVEQLNKPALEYRKWVAEKLGVTGLRPRQWMGENLAAHVAAAWPVTQIKSDMTRNYTKSVKDETFTEIQRRMLIIQLNTLVGSGREYFKEITYFANGRIKVVKATSKVATSNIDKWRKRLAGIVD